MVTLGTIFGFVFVIVFLAAYYGAAADMPAIIGFTVLGNFLIWLLAPFFNDLIYRFAYKTKRMTIEELGVKSKKLADFIKRVCEKHKIKVPRLINILDDNPTAFTFGSGAFNARLCFSDGLFEYLDEEEIEAVIAHELGHIIRRDFIIMTVAATGVQILYELYRWMSKRSDKGNSKSKGGLAYAGLLAYVFYLVGTYLLLFLSRAREYGADAFSAGETQNPDALARALVKIAYGIVAKPDAPEQKRLLESTRALGPFDTRAARHLGTAYESNKQDWHAISKVVAFDLLSPWAKILQLQSTHPLTGKRIEHLNEISSKLGQKASIDTKSARNIEVDRRKLYGGFATGALIYFLPWILPLLCIIGAAALGNPMLLVWIIGAVGLAILVQLAYKYPETEPARATTLDMMSDIYASPMRGRPYSLDGKIIGRGTAGAYLSEDVMMQDSKGLIYLNYESAFSFIGNLFFALGRVRQLIGKKAAASGWFFRDVGHHFDIKEMKPEGESAIKSHPKLWGMIFGIVLIGISIFFTIPAGAASLTQILGGL